MNAPQKKLSILLFSPYYPPHIGGLESHADEFNKHLSRRGASIVVFTPHLPNSAPETEVVHNSVNVIRFPAFEIIHNYPVPKFWSVRFWHLFLPIFREHYDIVISRTRFFFLSFIALIYAKCTQTYWVHVEHGSDFVKLSSRVKTFIAKLYDYTIGRLIFRCSDLNISISKAVQIFVQKFDKRHSPVIYRGIDFDQLDTIQPNEAFRQKFANKIIIGTVARLYKWKGIEYSIEAIKSLPEDIKSEIVFIIIGDGEDFDRLRKLCDNNSIYMLGNLPREKVLSIVKTFDIYIHSSLPGGGLSTSLLEAMYCGCAVIATPHEGADEVVHDGRNGLLIKSKSPTSTQAAIKNLIKDKAMRTSQGENAHRDILKQFSWKRSIQQYTSLLKII